MLYQTEGIVLSSADLGEHDRLVTLLTLQKGLVRAVVRGARKPNSKLSAVTQPFTRADFQPYGRSSLDRVIQVSILDSHPGSFRITRRLCTPATWRRLCRASFQNMRRTQAYIACLQPSLPGSRSPASSGPSPGGLNSGFYGAPDSCRFLTAVYDVGKLRRAPSISRFRRAAYCAVGVTGRKRIPVCLYPSRQAVSRPSHLLPFHKTGPMWLPGAKTETRQRR